MTATRFFCVAVLVLCVASNRASADSCPSSQPCERYSVQNFFKANWQRASQACSSQGMRLASILSAADQAAIQTQIANLGLQKNRFWVSANARYAGKSVFTWENGRGLAYTNWAGGEPSGGLEECIELKINDQKWNDALCSLEQYFVCETIPFHSSRVSCGTSASSNTTPSPGFTTTESPTTFRKN